MGGFTGILESTADSLRSADSSFSDTVSGASDQLDLTTLGIQVFYGVMIGLSVLSLLAVVLMTFFDKAGCRYLAYFSCVIMTILGILGFLIASVYSILVPIFFYSCDFSTSPSKVKLTSKVPSYLFRQFR